MRVSCRRLIPERAQTVIADVNADARFASHRDIAAASGFRAVQSTPLVDRDGRLLGVVSTHYPQPHAPSQRDLQLLSRYGEVVGQAMSNHLGAPQRLDHPQRLADLKLATERGG